MSEDNERSQHEFPPQTQERPGLEHRMDPEPRSEMRDYEGSGKLDGRRALVTGGDSGIGRAVSIAFAKEGAEVAFAYISEDTDADETTKLIAEAGKDAHPMRADLQREDECERIVAETVENLGGLDLLVLHHGTQTPQDRLEDISTEQWEGTLRTNLTSFFWIARAALPHMGEGASIVMTGPSTAFAATRR